MHKIHIFIIVIAAFTLSACAQTHLNGGRMGMFTPRPMFLGKMPQGDDSFSVGIRHGCNTALGIVGSAMLRTHGWQYDVNKGIEDREYYRGVRLGTRYCMMHLSRDVL